MTNVIENQNQPLASLDEWEDDLLRRYPNPEVLPRKRRKHIATMRSRQEIQLRNFTD